MSFSYSPGLLFDLGSEGGGTVNGAVFHSEIQGSGIRDSEFSLAHHDGLAADSHARDCAVLAVDRNVNAARSQHRNALEAQDVPRSLRRHNMVMEQIAPERTAGAAGGGILGDTEPGSQHAAVYRLCRRGVRFALGGEEEALFHSVDPCVSATARELLPID